MHLFVCFFVTDFARKNNILPAPFQTAPCAKISKDDKLNGHRSSCMKLNYSIIFLSEILKISCRTDIVDQGQTTQTVQSDVESTLSVNLEDAFLSKM